MIKPCVFILNLLLLAQTTVPVPDHIKIGVFLSLTGATAAYGMSSIHAIELATHSEERRQPNVPQFVTHWHKPKTFAG